MKTKLSKNRKNTIINNESKIDEAKLIELVDIVYAEMKIKYPQLNFVFKKRLLISEIITSLKKYNPNATFYQENEKSFIMPDGGFIFVENKETKELFPILISEIKNQGTLVQNSGNAIERLGKNVIGIRRYCKSFGFVPFACFGYGATFRKDSSIAIFKRTYA